MEETISIPKKDYEKLLREHARFKEEIRLLKRMIHGSKSERFVPTDSGQTSLFEEEQKEQAQAISEEETEEVSCQRKKPKKQPKRAIELPKHLRRETYTLEPELPSGKLGRKIGVEINEALHYIPGELYVKRIERPKYIVEENSEEAQEQAPSKEPSSEELPENTQIAIAELPTQIIPRGNAGASLLAYILVAKFIDHLPFYRQRMIFKRSGVDIAPSTIGGWMNKTCELLDGLYHLLVEQVQQSDYLQADESPLKVQDQHKKGTTHQGYMWVYHDPLSKNVVFQYDRSRSQRVPAQFFEGMKAVVQTDGYKAYNILEKQANKDIILIACMAHARRKFEQARDNDQANAEKALHYFQQLYALEREAREQELSHESRQQLRQEKAEPILEQMHSWLQEIKDGLLPKSRIGIAVNYTLELWPRLKKYTQDGRYEIDNNFVENTIRPLALGRKNYLFAGSHEAAQRAAMVYSLFASCKANEVNPYAWLKEVLEVIPDHRANELHELLPSSPRFKPES